MNYEKAMENVREISKELGYLKNISGLLSWDQWTGTPVDGKSHISKLSGYMAKNMTDLIKSEKATKTAEFLNANTETEKLTDIDKALIRKFLSEFNTTVNVTSEQKRERVVLLGASREAWVKAKEASDYNIFKPHFKKAFDYCLEIYKASYPNIDTFEGMLQLQSEGLTLEKINAEFSKLRDGIAMLLEKINNSKIEIRSDFLEREFDKAQLEAFVKKTMYEVGLDKNKNATGYAPHPFTSRIGPRDARLTLNYKSFSGAFFAGLHEAGHAMYGYRTNEELVNEDLYGGIGGGFHEAQAKFYENMVGRSKAFCEYIFPKLQAEFEQFSDVTAEEFYRAVNKVQPSLIRTRADEVTYSLHPIIRFEIEQELIRGEIAFEDLPQIWNDRYEKYLGIRPENDADGILQDMHWGTGLFAYFQTYTLGNIYDGQILNALLKDENDIYEDIKNGKFDRLNNWITENIHQYGSLYTETEMIKKVTGESINADYFLNYLNKKYSEIYGFDI